MMPPGFGAGGDPAGAEPAGKRPANGSHGGGGGGGGGPWEVAALAAAPSWDVETQFAVGALGGGSSYLGAAAGGNLSPDAAQARGGSLSYSPMAASGAGHSPDGQQQQQQQPGSVRPASAAYSHAGGQAAGEAGNGGMHLSPMSDDDAPPPLPPPPPAQQPQHSGGEQDGWDTPDAAFAAFVADMVRRRVGKYAQPDHPMCITQDEASQVGGGSGRAARCCAAAPPRGNASWCCEGIAVVVVMVVVVVLCSSRLSAAPPAAGLPPLCCRAPPLPCLSASCPQLYTKIRREIVEKEKSAYEQRQAAGAFKPIERGKLEVRHAWGVLCCDVRLAGEERQGQLRECLVLPVCNLLLLPGWLQSKIREFVRDSIRRYHERRGGF